MICRLSIDSVLSTVRIKKGDNNRGGKDMIIIVGTGKLTRDIICARLLYSRWYTWYMLMVDT